MKSILTKFFVLSVVTLTLTELTKSFFQLDKLIYNKLLETLTSNQINEFFVMQEKWHWLNYLVVPIFIFLKTILIVSIVHIGVFFFSKKQVLFKQIWNIVLNAEFIFLLVPVFKIIWFYFFESSYKLEDIQYFYPLSAINVTGYNGLEQWLIYPFQTLNLFEVAYIIYLGYELGKLTETNHDRGLKIMVYSYVPMMFLWIAVVMFFTLNYS